MGQPTLIPFPGRRKGRRWGGLDPLSIYFFLASLPLALAALGFLTFFLPFLPISDLLKIFHLKHYTKFYIIPSPSPSYQWGTSSSRRCLFRTIFLFSPNLTLQSSLSLYQRLAWRRQESSFLQR